MEWMMNDQLTHLDEHGQASMVDVSDKPVLHRVAVAEGFLVASPATLDRLEAGDLPKGEALGVARIAGIMAAKRCSELIPLCHPLPLDHAAVEFERVQPDRIRIEARATTSARTGVEMEALTAATIAALTIYDMTKAIEHSATIEGVQLLSKHKEAPC